MIWEECFSISTETNGELRWVNLQHKTEIRQTPKTTNTEKSEKLIFRYRFPLCSPNL